MKNLVVRLSYVYRHAKYRCTATQPDYQPSLKCTANQPDYQPSLKCLAY